MCVRACTHTHTHMWAHTCTQIHTMRTHTCTHTQRTHIHARPYTQCAYTYTHAHTDTYTQRTHTHTHIHTAHTCAYTHTSTYNAHIHTHTHNAHTHTHSAHTQIHARFKTNQQCRRQASYIRNFLLKLEMTSFKRGLIDSSSCAPLRAANTQETLRETVSYLIISYLKTSYYWNYLQTSFPGRAVQEALCHSESVQVKARLALVLRGS